jgi:predicted amidohydrolase YtcJ
VKARFFIAHASIASYRSKTGFKEKVKLPADLALINAKVRTMNPALPLAEAVAIKKDRILKVGINEAVSPLIGKKTRVIDLNGKIVVPGFIDTHIHVADFGKCLLWLDLNGVKSIEELQRRLKERAQATASGKWIVGRGWNQARFRERRLPTLSDLDSVSPNNPVILYHESAMIGVVNSKALDMSSVTKVTPAPSGGEIDKDPETGELTGVLRDGATELVWRMVPEPSEDELLEATALACEKIAEAGVTSAHWMVLSANEISIMKLQARKRLPIRVNAIIPASLLDKIEVFMSNDAAALRVSGAVIAADGYLASKTAALFQPYSGEPEANGCLLLNQDELNTCAGEIVRTGLQLVIHAMGDKAVDAALTTIEHVKASYGKVGRCRIEQAAVLNEALIGRIRAQQVVVSVQPRVIASEFAVWHATENLGVERARWLYPLKTLLSKGVRVIGGSDCPMEPLNPLLGIQDAVTREHFAEQRLSVEEAMRMYTVNAAYASNEENIKGSIEEGKLADLAVLSRDPERVEPNQISEIAVDMTIIGGKILFYKH